MLFDSHCHLQFKAYKDDFDQVLKRCEEKQMLLNVVGSQIDTSVRAVELAQKYENIYASVGLHPIHLFETHVDEEEVAFKSREEDFDYDKYKKLARNKKVVAIGECGLEFFHLPAGLNKEQALQKQKEVFLAQYKLAQELKLPIIIHVRDAHQEMIDLLREIGEPINGVVHCYTGNWEYAEQYLALGLYLGFTGVITFPPKKTDPKAQEDLLEVIKNCPWDRMLIETDAPYLAPQSHRGQRAEPWMVEDVALKIADIKRTETEEIIQITTNNAKKLFKL
ncbi:MAG TPA: TatD family hydrolase [Candidatus Magasanikbacteria bacterium]|nr:TatD family hydrolase [Candidatus Magasanikbacteria bacterium]